MLLSPSSADGVKITGTDTTSLDLDIDVVVTKGLGLELVELEVSPMLRILNLEALEGIWVNHSEIN